MLKIRALLVATSLIFESIGLNGASARMGPPKGGCPSEESSVVTFDVPDQWAIME
jgi:hypothetical protein